MSTLSEYLEVEAAIRKAESELDPFTEFLGGMDPKRAAVRRSIDRLEKLKGVLRAKLDDGHGTMAAEPIVWTGPDREFAAWIVGGYDRGHLAKATSRRNALEQACKHFQDKSGAPFNPKILQQGLLNKRNEQKP